MRGGLFSRRTRRFTPDGFYDPNPQRTTTRISYIYATPWHLPDEHGLSLRAPTDELRLGRVGSFYKISTDQLPKVLYSGPLDPTKLVFKRFEGNRRSLAAARLWLFATPSRQIVAAFTLDTNLNIEGVIDLLEDCYYLDIHLDQSTLESHIRELVSQFEVSQEAGSELLPERHQLAFGAKLPERNCDDVVQRIIYRKDLPYRKEFSSIKYPGELNRRPGNTVAIGPYVSAICGHQNDVENCALLSAVQAVASATRLREIRQAAYEAVASFRHIEQATMTITSRRRTLEELADKLTHLELELSHSVETTADIGLLVPSLRVESYHVALFDAMNLSHRADIAARMLERLDRAINSGLTAVQSIERRNDDERRLRWAVAVGFVSTIAIPLTLVLAYFGINSKEVTPNRSMFDVHYLGAYITIALILVAAILPSIALFIQQRRRSNGNAEDPSP